MKRTAVIFIASFLLFTLFILSPLPLSDTHHASALRSGIDDEISTVVASFLGENIDSGAGTSVSIAGDVNGDGFDDILIGSYENRGQIYVIFGKASGLSLDTSLSNADARIICEYPSDLAKYVSGAGDVNGDGFDDILIGAPGNSEGGNRAGQVYLVFGSASGWSMDMSLSSADASFLGENMYDYAGGDGIYRAKRTIVSVAGAGDVNGDGFDDILIGAHGNDDGGEDAGKSYIIFGRATGWSRDVDLSNADASFIGENAYDYAGKYSCRAGDINGDGYDDILIGSEGNGEGGNNAGQAYLIFGRATGWSVNTDLSNADASFIGENAEDGLGISVAGAGDLNGDGYDDIVLDAPFNDESGTDAGKIYIIFGRDTGWSMNTGLSVTDVTFLGENAGDRAGWPTAGAGDVNGDGYDDIVISTFWNNNDRKVVGQTYLILGKESGWPKSTNLSNADVSFIGENAGDNFGTISGSGTGDVNGDGYDDILIGANGNDEGGSWAGQVYLFLTFSLLITTEDISSVTQHEFYSVDYDAWYIYNQTDLQWFLKTDLSSLTINKDTGVLSGTPTNDDVGFHHINVSVSGPNNRMDYHNFTLEVINVNDIPEWTDVPSDIEINEGDTFLFDVNAIDIDKGAKLVYNISTDPTLDISMDPVTGLIEWTASLKNLLMPFKFEVTLSVSDGDVTSWSYFQIKVKPNLPPEVKLISPKYDSRVSASGFELEWLGFDYENDPLTYDVYIGESGSKVNNHDASLKILDNTIQTFYKARGFESGKTYYWTVIPFDGLNYGKCLDGIFSFEVNSPPTFYSIKPQKTSTESKYTLDINARDENLDDVIKFVYSLDSAPEGMSIENDTGIISWAPENDHLGKHTVQVRVSDGTDQSNVTFEIEVYEITSESAFTPQTVIIITSSTLLIIIIGFFVTLTEAGKYKSLSLLFVPMYNKLNREKVLDNSIRDRIHGYIQSNPGERFNSIKVALNLNIGRLAHHLRVLEKEDYVYSKRDMFSTRFYPIELGVQEMMKPKVNEIQKEIIDLVRRKPGITQNDIVSELKKNQKTVSYNLTWLVRYNLIDYEQKGRFKKYYLNDKVSEYKSFQSLVIDKISEPGVNAVPMTQSDAPAMSGSEKMAALPPVSSSASGDIDLPDKSGASGTRTS
jgi:predicted transcriptional regulator